MIEHLVQPFYPLRAAVLLARGGIIVVRIPPGCIIGVSIGMPGGNLGS